MQNANAKTFLAIRLKNNIKPPLAAASIAACESLNCCMRGASSPD